MIGKLTTIRTIPNSLVLDQHTAAFFSPKYHQGEVEVRFRFRSRLDPTVEQRIFGARLARLLTSE